MEKSVLMLLLAFSVVVNFYTLRALTFEKYEHKALLIQHNNLLKEQIQILEKCNKTKTSRL